MTKETQDGNNKKFWSLQEFKEAFKDKINKKTNKTSIGGFIEFSKR